jgi:uncharacterized protein (UPF0261 family)
MAGCKFSKSGANRRSRPSKQIAEEKITGMAKLIEEMNANRPSEGVK